MPNLSKIRPTSIEKRPQIDNNSSLERFRRQIAPRSARMGSPSFGVIGFWRLFGRKWCSKGSFCNPSGTQNLLKIALLALDRRRVPRKITSRKGVWRMHENLMKFRCTNLCSSMARNHVWRYTLHLFHTFAIFENNRKINENRDPESRAFWSKNEPWTRRVRLRGPFFLIFRDLQNR